MHCECQGPCCSPQLESLHPAFIGFSQKSWPVTCSCDARPLLSPRPSFPSSSCSACRQQWEAREKDIRLNASRRRQSVGRSESAKKLGGWPGLKKKQKEAHLALPNRIVRQPQKHMSRQASLASRPPRNRQMVLKTQKRKARNLSRLFMRTHQPHHRPFPSPSKLHKQTLSHLLKHMPTLLPVDYPWQLPRPPSFRTYRQRQPLSTPGCFRLEWTSLRCRHRRATQIHEHPVPAEK